MVELTGSGFTGGLDVHTRVYKLARTGLYVKARVCKFARTDLYVQTRVYRFARTDLYVQTRVYKRVGTDLNVQTRVYRIGGGGRTWALGRVMLFPPWGARPQGASAKVSFLWGRRATGATTKFRFIWGRILGRECEIHFYLKAGPWSECESNKRLISRSSFGS